jgi:signal transduction histidine kinase
MDTNINCPLAPALSQELRKARDDLTHRWLDRIVARVSLDRNRVFPSDELIDHVPVLIDGIADYVEDPADEISADMPVVAKAMELGQLRHSQGFDAHEILKEYEILGGVLFSFLIGIVDSMEQSCTKGELLSCGHRLFRAVSVIQQVTTGHYLTLATDLANDREERLRGFNRTLSHEMKNRIGAVVGATQMMQEDWIQTDAEQVKKFAAIAVSNADAMQAVLQDLLALSQTDTDTRQQRHVLLPETVAEVKRQLREMAENSGVTVTISDSLPEVEVNASVVELCLTNYLSNAIKYADPNEPEKRVEVGGAISDHAGEIEVWVKDNGVGVPPDQRDRLFERYFRAPGASERGIDGTGLGLSIVQETIEAAGGRAWAEFDDGSGSTFKISLPVRRAADS